MSLKTFWYLKLPKLSESPRYEDSLCKDVFLRGNWNENPICSLTVGESTSDDVQQAIDQYQEMHGISHSKIKQILEQLVIIWSMYTTSYPQAENPANIVLTEISVRDSAKSKMRDALALRSLTKPQMRTFMRLLDEDTQNPVLSLVARAKSILHLSSGAAAALTIRDYFKVTNFDLKCLRITKALPASCWFPCS